MKQPIRHRITDPVIARQQWITMAQIGIGMGLIGGGMAFVPDRLWAAVEGVWGAGIGFLALFVWCGMGIRGIRMRSGKQIPVPVALPLGAAAPTGWTCMGLLVAWAIMGPAFLVACELGFTAPAIAAQGTPLKAMAACCGGWIGLWLSHALSGKWGWEWIPGRLGRTCNGMIRCVHMLGLAALCWFIGIAGAYGVAWIADIPIRVTLWGLGVATAWCAICRSARVAALWRFAVRQGLGLRGFYMVQCGLAVMGWLLVYTLAPQLTAVSGLGNVPWRLAILADFSPHTAATGLIWASWGMGSWWIASAWAQWAHDKMAPGSKLPAIGWREIAAVAAIGAGQCFVLTAVPPIGIMLAGIVAAGYLLYHIPSHTFAGFLWYAHFPMDRRAIRIHKRLPIKDIMTVQTQMAYVGFLWMLEPAKSAAWLWNGCGFMWVMALVAGWLGGGYTVWSMQRGSGQPGEKRRSG